MSETARRVVVKPPRSSSAFRDLLMVMLAFGLTVGAVFPPFSLVLGLPSDSVMRPVFWAACLAAGLGMGAMSFAIAGLVLGRRLEVISRFLESVTSAMVTDDPTSPITAERLECTSRDALGLLVQSTSSLLDVVAHARCLAHTDHEIAELALMTDDSRGFLSSCLARLAEMHAGTSWGFVNANGDWLVRTPARSAWVERRSVRRGDNLLGELVVAGTTSERPFRLESLLDVVAASLASSLDAVATTALLSDSLARSSAVVSEVQEVVDAMTTAESCLSETVVDVQLSSAGSVEQADRLAEATTSISEVLPLVLGSLTDSRRDITETLAISDRIGAFSSAAAADARESQRALRDLQSVCSDLDAMTSALEETSRSTSLLALNASIEAARAGAAGAGFAVVAENVREVAAISSETSGTVIAQIRRLIEETEATIARQDKLTAATDEIEGQCRELLLALEHQQATINALEGNVDRVGATAGTLESVTGSILEAVTAAERTAAGLKSVADDLSEASSSLSEAVAGD